MKQVIITTFSLDIWASILILSACVEKHKKYITELKYHNIFNIVIIVLPWIVMGIVLLLEHFKNLYWALVNSLLVVYAFDFVSLLIETFYLYFKPAFKGLRFIYVVFGALLSYFAIIITGSWFEVMLKHYIQTVSTTAKTISFLSIVGAIYSVVQSIISYCNDYNEYRFTSNNGELLCNTDKKKIQAKIKNFHVKLYELIVKCIGVIYPIFIVFLIYKFIDKRFQLQILKQTIKFNYLLTPNKLEYTNMALILLLGTSLIFIGLFTAINFAMKKYYHVKK